MLLYLAQHTCPDIADAVICAARYMFYPKLVHKHALKEIGSYFFATSDKGLIMKPSKKLLKIDSVSDANLAGMYGYKAMYDHVCVKSRTGYVISPYYNLRLLYLAWRLRLLP